MENNQLIDKAIVAAIKAGEKIREVYTYSDFSIQLKADKTPVTLADQLAHEQILAILAETNLPVLSEEGFHLNYSERKKWDKFWLVDPLDGTKEFIKKNGEFTVNIALIEKNTTIAGVVYLPVGDELFVGVIGLGSFKLTNPSAGCNLNSIREEGKMLQKSDKPAVYTILTSRSHQNPETIDYIEQIKIEHPDATILPMGSSLKLCRIAEGKASVYPKIGKTMEWDTAAGHAVLKAVGKNIFEVDMKTELAYNKENLQNPNFIAI